MSKRILAIDDDPDVLEMYSLILTMEGYDVKTLLSPDNLSGAIFDFVPDLILLDIQLGYYNGLEICSKLKSNPLTTHIPVFIISAHESIHKAKTDFNADDYILKPFDMAHLLEKIDDRVSGKVVSFRRASA
ncbi:response regulator [Desertivirga xinjiangensis]|uniref:response regulator n=1 Tax=Desertivirga xinjiangensis TaxID=539206 RepID=UPI002108B6E8|nr:response regulator [Pedobacter xinjiangensis]